MHFRVRVNSISPESLADTLNGVFHPSLPRYLQPKILGDASDPARIQRDAPGVDGGDQLAGATDLRRAFFVGQNSTEEVPE